MFGRRNKNYLYMFPSQMKSNIRHNRVVLIRSIIFGLIFSALFGLLVYWANTR